MMYVLLLVGFVLLIKGADLFVDGSSSVARLLGVPGVVIGLTIVAMGTSAPEAAVSITAGLNGSNAIALSNVIGSNLFNLLVVAGGCAAIRAFPMDPDILRRDFPVNLAANTLLILMLLSGALERWEGLLLLAIFITYLFFVVRGALRDRNSSDSDQKTLSPLHSVLLIVIGLAAVIFGGDLVVDNAVLIARSWGWSESFIGLTIIAMGTSLPELVTSLAAARRGESGLALGNVIGSNIFNILLILGLSSSLHPIAAPPDALLNTIWMFVATLLLYLWCRARKEVIRPVGGCCVAAYFAYTVFLILS